MHGQGGEGEGALTELASAKDDDMPRIRIREHLATSLIAAKRDSWSVIINGVNFGEQPGMRCISHVREQN